MTMSEGINTPTVQKQGRGLQRFSENLLTLQKHFSGPRSLEKAEEAQGARNMFELRRIRIMQAASTALKPLAL